MFPSFLSCFLCVRTFYSISPYYFVYYVSMLSLYFTISLCLCFQVTCTISLYWYVMFPSFLFCFLCVRTFYSISPYPLCMFMFPHFRTISPCIFSRARYVSIPYAISPYTCMFMFPSFLSCFLCVRTFYSVSPYFMCLCFHVFVLFHHIY